MDAQLKKQKAEPLFREPRQMHRDFTNATASRLSSVLSKKGPRCEHRDHNAYRQITAKKVNIIQGRACEETQWRWAPVMHRALVILYTPHGNTIISITVLKQVQSAKLLNPR